MADEISRKGEIRMYKVYDMEDRLVMETEHPAFSKWDPKMCSFYDVPESEAEVITVQPENGESYYANIQGKEIYSWLPTVKVVKE